MCCPSTRPAPHSGTPTCATGGRDAANCGVDAGPRSSVVLLPEREHSGQPLCPFARALTRANHSAFSVWRVQTHHTSTSLILATVSGEMGFSRHAFGTFAILSWRREAFLAWCHCWASSGCVSRSVKARPLGSECIDAHGHGFELLPSPRKSGNEARRHSVGCRWMRKAFRSVPEAVSRLWPEGHS